MDLSRTVFVFSQIWLASVMAMPLMIGAAKAADPSFRIGLCAPCAATTKAIVTADFQPRLGLTTKTH